MCQSHAIRTLRRVVKLCVGKFFRQFSMIMAVFKTATIRFLVLFVLDLARPWGCNPDDHCLMNKICKDSGFNFGHCTTAAAPSESEFSNCPAGINGICTYCPTNCDCDPIYTLEGNVVLTAATQTLTKRRTGRRPRLNPKDPNFCVCCQKMFFSTNNLG